SAMMAEHFDDAVALYRRAPAKTPGAIILFRIAERPIHCGLYLQNGVILHASRQADTILSNITEPDYASCAVEYYLPSDYHP
ncbi:MAG: NlpC/P60 family protein, partial [Deltaproteobacteria bacterium]|nr:NlpC/P60 family protein [Deltaproteobacteria bacterium]